MYEGLLWAEVAKNKATYVGAHWQRQAHSRGTCDMNEMNKSAQA